MTRACGLGSGALALLLLLGTVGSAGAHGFAGARFFPATLTTDDPFVADELSLPTVSFFNNPASGDSPSSHETDFAVEFSKVIFPHFGLSVNETLIHLAPQGDKAHTAFGNLGVGGKYELLVNGPHEAIVSVGLDAELGGTGRASVGADSFSTLTPGVFFGKGMGDLPDAAMYLKPFAVTGVLGVSFPTNNSIPNALQWGLALEYSLPYLQAQVKDVGLPAWVNRLIPLVEFSFQSPLNRGGGQTTGTINPGLLWAGKYLQLGVEALIPVNAASGHNVGVIAQLHFYLDDLFPAFFGKPLFGGK